MARPNNSGWDFVKVGGTYQYKEEIAPMTSFFGEVTILEDNSTDEYYSFKLRVDKSNMDPPTEDGIFEVGHAKTADGLYSGMPQFYEQPEYGYRVDWSREQKGK